MTLTVYEYLDQNPNISLNRQMDIMDAALPNPGHTQDRSQKTAESVEDVVKKPE